MPQYLYDLFMADHTFFFGSWLFVFKSQRWNEGILDFETIRVLLIKFHSLAVWSCPSYHYTSTTQYSTYHLDPELKEQSLNK